MGQIKVKEEAEFKRFLSSEADRCRYALADQYGNIICVKNLDALGFCDGIENCSYVLKKGRML